jgi:hypothetical protein
MNLLKKTRVLSYFFFNSRELLLQIATNCSSPYKLLQIIYQSILKVSKIVRDSNGYCLAARSLSVNIHTDASTAEALAAVQAIMFCKELGYSNILFEGDALQAHKSYWRRRPMF